MARVCWLTDPHLDFLTHRQFDALVREIRAGKPDAVLIGGDVAESETLARGLASLDDRLAAPIYFVLGNHDFYRGSIEEVRDRTEQFALQRDKLHYLTRLSVVELANGTGLIGHDGWADARAGDYERSNVMLSDYSLIRELSGLDRSARRAILERLGDEAAEHVRQTLRQSLERFEHTVLLTHVPPLREACWHEGNISDDQWSPHFTCVAVGRAMLEVMADHPDRRLTVLCGHTHSPGEIRPAPNVHVLTGQAEYGVPRVQQFFEWE